MNPLLPILFVAFQTPALKVGDPAPPLTVGNWLKGTPTPKLERGRVYVVEFWATWCAPCKISMPHLSEIARKLKGKADVIGVDVWERPPTTEADVKAFVANMGDRMDYHVVRDDAAGTMATTWLRAAGRNGIPSAFVVGRDGKVAWIGHPMDRMESVLQAVVENRFDPVAEAARTAKQDTERKAAVEASNAYRKALAAGERAKAEVDLASFAAAHPQAARSLWSGKYQALLAHDESAAYAFAAELAAGDYKRDAQGLYLLCAMIVKPLRPLQKPDLALAQRLAEQASALPPTSAHPYLAVTLAEIHVKQGRKEAAEGVLKAELDRLTKDKSADPNAVAAVKKALETIAE